MKKIIAALAAFGAVLILILGTVYLTQYITGKVGSVSKRKLKTAFVYRS